MVRLKPDSETGAILAPEQFTFHYGEIKAYPKTGAALPWRVFTFHYGEIKAVRRAFSDESDGDLHSTMVRLKQNADERLASFLAIYIPLW